MVKTAFVHKTSSTPYKQFFNSGWETIPEVQTFVGMEHLKDIDGEFDVCIVGPGGFRYDEDLYRKSSGKTKFVFIDDEDMHHSVEQIRCIASYYDYVCIYSEVNYLALRSLGVKNVIHILPSVDARYFGVLDVEQTLDVTFIGQQGGFNRIGEGTRLDYLIQLEGKNDIKSFIGRGFYCEDASKLYNQSRIGLDLPVTFAVGARAFQIGVTNAMLMIPAGIRSKLWYDHFTPGKDYAEFEPTFEGFHEALKHWIGDTVGQKRLSDSMREKVLAGHTFQHRYNEILNHIQ